MQEEPFSFNVHGADPHSLDIIIDEDKFGDGVEKAVWECNKMEDNEPFTIAWREVEDLNA